MFPALQREMFTAEQLRYRATASNNMEVSCAHIFLPLRSLAFCLARQLMCSIWFRGMLREAAHGLIASLALCCTVLAQEISVVDSGPLNSGAAVELSPVVKATEPEVPRQQGFWDRENLALFGAVAALSAADFATTRTNLQNGGKELDPITRTFGHSTAGLAVNFGAETAGVIGMSYFFHKTGHHKLERLTSMINIGASTTAVAYDLTHR